MEEKWNNLFFIAGTSEFSIFLCTNYLKALSEIITKNVSKIVNYSSIITLCYSAWKSKVSFNTSTVNNSVLQTNIYCAKNLMIMWHLYIWFFMKYLQLKTLLQMGGSQSIEVPGGGTEGYHVLRVQDNSPGSRAGLEAFFDFIVAIGKTRLNQDNDTLKDLLKVNVEKEINMTVYSSKTRMVSCSSFQEMLKSEWNLIINYLRIHRILRIFNHFIIGSRCSYHT